MDQKVEDGLVSLGPKKAIGTAMKELMIVGETKSFPRKDPTEAGSMVVRRRLAVPKRSRKKNVADGDEQNQGTIQKYFANKFVKGLGMDEVSLDLIRKPKRDAEKDDEKSDDAIGKKLKMSATSPVHRTIKKATEVPGLKKSRGAKSKTRKEPRNKGMKEISNYFMKIGAKDVVPLGIEKEEENCT